ncbi:MAG: hypothetical protein ACQESK_09945 [Bacteroidota bacterium]
MEIINTFAVVEDSLYSVQYKDEFLHEFEKYFDLWNDPMYLRAFFEEHISDLKSDYWKNTTIEEAILRTRKEAKQLEKKLLDLAKTGKINRYETLSTLFKPLSKGKMGEFEKDKAKGLSKNSWIRIYAIRLEANLFVVCGGAIKLTETMNNRDHLLKELDKLEFTRNYLMDTEEDNLGFVEIN